MTHVSYLLVHAGAWVSRRIDKMDGPALHAGMNLRDNRPQDFLRVYCRTFLRLLVSATPAPNQRCKASDSLYPELPEGHCAASLTESWCDGVGIKGSMGITASVCFWNTCLNNLAD